MSRKVLIFDSGLGGTTVLKEIQHRLPNIEYSYALDNEAFPYGNKSNRFLIDRITRIFDQLITTAAPDLVVIACNTASTLILNALRERFDIPFVGVVPAIKPAAQLSRTRVIGLLATEATVRRDYIAQLEEAHAAHCDLIRLPCQQLVEIAEQKILGNSIDQTALLSVIDEIKQHERHGDIDTYILGCTHFPALRDELARHWPDNINWIDTGEAIARRVDDLLTGTTISDRECPGALYTTSDINTDRAAQTLLPFGIERIQRIVIE